MEVQTSSSLEKASIDCNHAPPCLPILKGYFTMMLHWQVHHSAPRRTTLAMSHSGRHTTQPFCLITPRCSPAIWPPEQRPAPFACPEPPALQEIAPVYIYGPVSGATLSACCISCRCVQLMACLLTCRGAGRGLCMLRCGGIGGSWVRQGLSICSRIRSGV